MSHEDIRRSIEVLDSVLAEFDDCLESWDVQSEDLGKYEYESRRKLSSHSEEYKVNGNGRDESRCTGSKRYSQVLARDGSTIHILHSNGAEQIKVGSPPPIPKRSPTTRLSEYNSSTFQFPESFASHSPSYPPPQGGSSDISASPPDRAVQELINTALSENEAYRNSHNRDNCSNCGRWLRNLPSPMESSEDSPTSFQQTRQVFESKLGDASSTASKSPLWNSPSFREKRTKVSEESAANLSSESGIDNDSGSYDELTSETPIGMRSSEEKRNDSEFSVRKSGRSCYCREKIRLLNERFTETKRLLKLNMIKGLDSKPPSFIPTPPPSNVTEHRNDCALSVSQHADDLHKQWVIEHSQNTDSSIEYNHKAKLNGNASNESSPNDIYGSHPNGIDDRQLIGIDNRHPNGMNNNRINITDSRYCEALHSNHTNVINDKHHNAPVGRHPNDNSENHPTGMNATYVIDDENHSNLIWTRSLENSTDGSHVSKLNLNRSLDNSIDGSPQSRLNWTGSLDSLRLCSRCSNHVTGTVGDVPKLLPTDALNRPYLGLSYSMEDDLYPEVKEIRETGMTTSTPKSDASSFPNLFRGKEDSGLSTFSQSVSSLGYVSSQSDWELNHLPNVPDKVPVSTFRSRTLPNGLDRSPFYSASEEMYVSEEHSSNNGVILRDPRIDHLSSEELSNQRSSSAPLPPEVEKPKKHFRVFSRKSKKDKNKSGAIP